jgi:hypothetical protein
MPGGFTSIYRGRVVETNDPSGRMRVKVSVPDVLGPASAWAMPCVPFGAPPTSPPVASTVWVMFERGDPSYPVVMGASPAG